MNTKPQNTPEPSPVAQEVVGFAEPKKASHLSIQDFLDRLKDATTSHVVISDKRAVVMTTKTDEKPEPEESQAPLPVGSRVWYWQQFQELFFLIPGQEPFRVAGVQSYSIKKWADIGLRRVGKNGPFVRAVHK
ncbi:MAG: hypothetical protein WC343_02415 [Bacilli bacterium]|jgi:hypothetical protein